MGLKLLEGFKDLLEGFTGRKPQDLTPKQTLSKDIQPETFSVDATQNNKKSLDISEIPKNNLMSDFNNNKPKIDLLEGFDTEQPMFKSGDKHYSMDKVMKGLSFMESSGGTNIKLQYEPEYHKKMLESYKTKKWIPTPAERRVIKERGFDEATKLFSTSRGEYQLIPETVYRYTDFTGNPEDLDNPIINKKYAMQLMERNAKLGGGDLGKSIYKWNQGAEYMPKLTNFLDSQAQQPMQQVQAPEQSLNLLSDFKPQIPEQSKPDPLRQAIESGLKAVRGATNFPIPITQQEKNLVSTTQKVVDAPQQSLFKFAKEPEKGIVNALGYGIDYIRQNKEPITGRQLLIDRGWDLDNNPSYTGEFTALLLDAFSDPLWLAPAGVRLVKKLAPTNILRNRLTNLIIRNGKLTPDGAEAVRRMQEVSLKQTGTMPSVNEIVKKWGDDAIDFIKNLNPKERINMVLGKSGKALVPSGGELGDAFKNIPKPTGKDIGKVAGIVGKELLQEALKYKSAEEFVESQIKKDYRSTHQVDTKASSSITEINENTLNSFIDEFKNQYGYPALKSKDVNKLKKIISNPDADIKIYRASPKNELNYGDWVTIDKDYANDIKRQNGGKVYSHTVRAKDLFYPKTLEGFKELPSLNKWGAFQYQSSKTKQQLTDIWNKAQEGKAKVEENLSKLAEKITVKERGNTISIDMGNTLISGGKIPKGHIGNVEVESLPDKNGFVELKGIRVEEKYRGKGFGQNLLMNALNELSKKGIKGIKSIKFSTYDNIDGRSDNATKMFERIRKDKVNIIKTRKDGDDYYFKLDENIEGKAKKPVAHKTLKAQMNAEVDPKSIKDYNKKELAGDGIRPTGTMSIDKWVQELQSTGQLQVPENMNPVDYAIEQAKDNALTVAGQEANIEKQIKEKDKKPKKKKVFKSTMTKKVAEVKEKSKARRIKDTVLDNIKKQLKTSAPVVKTSYPVGRYDYENNMLFKDLRDYSKMTQEKATEELAKLIPNIQSETDKIRARMLSVKADGKLKTSTEMYARLLDDIKQAKSIGLQTKTEEDFEKVFNRQKDVVEFVNKVKVIKGNKGNIWNIIANAYRKGIGDMYSVLNSIAGKDIAEKYNLEVAEDGKRTSIYFKYKDSIEKGIKSYGLKNKRELNGKFETMSKEQFKIVDTIDGLEKTINRFDLIDIYNSIKNESTKNLYYRGYGEGQINSLLQNLTNQDRVFADILQRQVQEYWDALNDKAIDLRGYELGRVDNYWMRTSETQPQDFDSFAKPSEVPSAMKTRAAIALPTPKNAWVKYQKYINQAEHVLQISDKYENLKRIINDRKVKNAIETKFGEDIFRHLNKQVDNLSLSRNWEEISYFENVLGKALNNWIRAKVASPSVFLKQLISTGNYSERMPLKEWTTGFFEGISKPRETAKYMNKIAPFLEARFKKGYSEAVERAVREAENAGKNMESWSNFLTVLPRTGDIGAIIYGGYPLVKYAMKPKAQGGLGMTEKQAAELFHKETLRAQQSSNLASKSEFQNSRNIFGRLFYAFKNTPNQYLRKNVNAVISYLNGDETAGQTAKTLLIYSVIQPALYALVGTLVGGLLLGKFKDKKGEEVADNIFRDIIEQLAVAPFTAVPFFNDIINASVRKAMGKKVWKVINMPMLDDLETSIRKLQKKDVTAKDLLYSLETGLELTTGVPAHTVDRYSKGAMKIFGQGISPKESKYHTNKIQFSKRANQFSSNKINFVKRKNMFE